MPCVKTADRNPMVRIRLRDAKAVSSADSRYLRRIGSASGSAARGAPATQPSGAEDRVPQRLVVECARRKKTERTGVRVFADIETVVNEVLDLVQRQRRADAFRLGT